MLCFKKGFWLVFDKVSIVFSIISIDFWSHDVVVCLCVYLTCMFIEIYIYMDIYKIYKFLYISLSFLGWVSSGACCFALQCIRLDSLLGAGLTQFAHRLDISLCWLYPKAPRLKKIILEIGYWKGSSCFFNLFFRNARLVFRLKMNMVNFGYWTLFPLNSRFNFRMIFRLNFEKEKWK